MLTARTSTRSALAGDEQSALTSARTSRHHETPRKMTSWMGSDKILSQEQQVEMDEGEKRAQARKLRERTAREMRAFIDSVEKQLAATSVSGGRASTAGNGRATASRDVAGAVRSEQHRGGAKLASYLDGSYHDRAAVERYNAHVAARMEEIMAADANRDADAEGEAAEGDAGENSMSGNARVPENLPQASTYALPAAAEGNGASPQGAKRSPAAGSGHKGYNVRALHSATKLMSHAAFTDVDFAEGFV